ncbi:SNF1-related protein kinase regulatory subunit gamma-1-like isoform X1 [Amborella trichopoda]|uniref:SNF1-related protein kinase regulatory subunit gamma-1-like isoform X1 n=1 Tax=Amborella trichopoda TaxID=13333 RepID=UPI0009BFB4B1|nr:SNF1-related protein kinase regulatory subunit gamma-1-like isoform X1 [Amborella trichopoda]|eukprot:XP_020521439.1 SNF1-related protein kinase regulatory subunit gamma-1-like isoform X1 [Amborella trichopoda]
MSSGTGPDLPGWVRWTSVDMADQDQAQETSSSPNFDAYFETIQSRKKLPHELQESLTSAFANIPVSSFPLVPGGKVIEIPAHTSIADTVRILSEHNIMSAPVTNPDASTTIDWRERYLGIIDYSSIVLWVLENAELAAIALSASSATVAGMGVGAVGALGALALGATGPAAVAGLTVAAVGAAMAGGMAAEKGMGKDAATAADHMGDDFYKVILQEEPFKSTTVKSIIKSFRWAPFLPVAMDSSMLTVLLLLSKYRLRNVPVIETGNPFIKNFITQSAVIHGLRGCKGRDWFDCIAVKPISDMGLPFMSENEVICIKKDELVLAAFKHMKENRIGGVPVIEGSSKKIIGNISIRDVRFLLLNHGLFYDFRQLTVMDFMNTIVSIATTLDGSHKTVMIPPVTCKANTSLGQVIETLAAMSFDRVYVVNDYYDVVGVVTLRDVISCFIFEPPNHFDDYFGFAVKEMLNQ